MTDRPIPARCAWPAAMLALLATAAWGCIGESPEVAREADLGPEIPGVPQGPEHRPGQPCLACHGEDYTPGNLVFVLAGTVFERPQDARGISNARVDFEDAAGRAFSARTNRVGNFFVRVQGSGSEPVRGANGELRLPFEPAFPLRVSVRSGDLEQSMRGLIWREGSCAACHAGSASATSNGPVYLEGDAP